MLAEMGKSAVGSVYKAGLPVLGVDGSLAHSGVTMLAKGHVFAKTGTTLDETWLVISIRKMAVISPLRSS